MWYFSESFNVTDPTIVKCGTSIVERLNYVDLQSEHSERLVSSFLNLTSTSSTTLQIYHGLSKYNLTTNDQQKNYSFGVNLFTTV